MAGRDRGLGWRCSLSATAVELAGDRCLPENIRMVSIPDLNCSDPLGPLGVVGRSGIGVVDRDITPFSLESFGSVAQHYEHLVSLD